MLYYFMVMKSSAAWANPEFWTNLYKVNVTGNDPLPSKLARDLCHAEASAHQAHVRIDRCVYWKELDRLPGDTAPEPVIPDLERDVTLVAHPTAAFRFGGRPGDGAGAEEFALRISKDVDRGRNGNFFYRGVLGADDVRGYPDNEAALKDVTLWRRFWDETFHLFWPYGVQMMQVERSGESAAKFGQYTPFLSITVRGVSLPRASDRAFARVATFRRAAFRSVMELIDGIVSIRSEFLEVLALNQDYVPFEFVSKAQAGMALGYAAAITAIQAVASNEDQELQDTAAYINKGGVPGDAIIGQGSIYASGKPNDLKPSEGFVQTSQILGQIEPDVIVPSGEYLSHDATQAILELVTPFWNSSFYLARGDYLHAAPRGS